MRVLKKGNTGKEVRIIQGWLNVLGYYNGKTDGSYGKVTKAAVINYQDAHDLVKDGIAGSLTQASMGFLPVKNPKIMVLKIPFSKIEKAGLLLKNKQKYSVESLAKVFGMNVAVNGPFFDINTMENAADLIDNGILIDSGNYTDKGLAYGNNFDNIGIYPSATSKSINKPVDFIGGCPALIQNGVKNVDMKGIDAGIYTQITRRMCTGVNKNAFYILMSLNNCNLEAMVQEGLSQELIFLKGNDGGGSQSFYLGNSTVVFTDGRSIPSAEGLLVKKEV